LDPICRHRYHEHYMSSIVGYLLFSVATFIAMANFYLSFVRAPLYRLLGRKCLHVSGIPLLGSLFLSAAIFFIERTILTWTVAAILLLIDTGGLLWLLLTVAWMALRPQTKAHWSEREKTGRLGSKRV
jgi:hypothetical protein